MATGDPEICPKCQAVFSKFSKIEKIEQMDKSEKEIWTCEFCCSKNEVCLDEEEIPKVSTINYLVEAAAQVADKKMGGQEISVVFCLDISGSMCVTESVKGKLNIKGSRLAQEKADLMKFGDGSDQFTNQAQKNITYISRL